MNNVYQEKVTPCLAANDYNMPSGKFTSVTTWKERWFLSSNAKYIETLYLIFALFASLAATSFSVLIILELFRLVVQYIGDNPLYNSINPVHATMIIFFVVMPALIGGFIYIKKNIKDIFIFLFYYIYTFITLYTFISMVTTISLINTILITFPFIWLFFFLRDILKRCIVYILGVIFFFLFIFLFIIYVQNLIVGLDMDIILKKVYPLIVSSLVVIPWIGFAIDSIFRYTDKLVPFYKFVIKLVSIFLVYLFIIQLCIHNEVIGVFILLTYDSMLVWEKIFWIFAILCVIIYFLYERNLEFIKDKDKINSYFWQISARFVFIPVRLLIWFYLPCMFNYLIIFTLFIFILALSMYLDNNFSLGKLIAILILSLFIVLIFINLVNPFILIPTLEYSNIIYNKINSLNFFFFLRITYCDTEENSYLLFLEEFCFSKTKDFQVKPVQSYFIETQLVRDSFNDVPLEEKIAKLKRNSTPQEIEKHLYYFGKQYTIIANNILNNTKGLYDLQNTLSEFKHNKIRGSSNSSIMDLIRKYDLRQEGDMYYSFPREWFTINTDIYQDIPKHINDKIIFAQKRLQSDLWQMIAVCKLLEGQDLSKAGLSNKHFKDHMQDLNTIKEKYYYIGFHRAKVTVDILGRTEPNKSTIIALLEKEKHWLGYDPWSKNPQNFLKDIGLMGKKR